MFYRLSLKLNFPIGNFTIILVISCMFYYVLSFFEAILKHLINFIFYHKDINDNYKCTIIIAKN